MTVDRDEWKKTWDALNILSQKSKDKSFVKENKNVD